MLSRGGKFIFHQYGPSRDADEMCCFATTSFGVLQIPAEGSTLLGRESGIVSCL